MVRQLKARMKGIARRQKDLLFPDAATRDYRRWMAAQLAWRREQYRNTLEPELLSVITAVWDGSPLRYFRELAESLASQIAGNRAEWFILANGCTRPALLSYLAELGKNASVTVRYANENRGIVEGLRQCLEHARGRYVLPVDADDRLYPDALQVVTAHIQQHSYPPILYTDEDKVSGAGIYQPYCKPDWDPVLLSNSAYIAHLGVVDRQLALDLNVYSDKAAEGSPDWDLFTRFAGAGHRPVHIPEIVYSWRIHSESTADDAGVKPYIRSSQEAVLQRFLANHPNGSYFDVQPSPLFGPAAAHWRFVRRTSSSKPYPFLWNRSTDLATLQRVAESLGSADSHIALLENTVEVPHADWTDEALGIFELFPDTVMVGGRLANQAGIIVDGPQCFGFGGVCGSPDRGRSLADPGYFGQMWKCRSASAVSSRLVVVRSAHLLRTLQHLPPPASLQNLGWWLGAAAMEGHCRVAYSPYLHAITSDQPELERSAEERAFRARYAHLLPDRRFYPEPFSLTHGYRMAYQTSKTSQPARAR